MVKRRKMLIGMGSLAAGSAGVLGTSASNTFNVNDRGMSIDVVADDGTGVIGIEDNSVGDIVNNDPDDDGNAEKLELDFAEYGPSEGVPLDSVITIGDDARSGEPAFWVCNQAAGQDLDFTATFEAGSTFNSKNGGSQLTIFPVWPPSGPGATNSMEIKWTQGVQGPGDSVTNDLSNSNSNDGPISPGDCYGVYLKMDTTGANSSPSEDFSGELSFSANSV